MEILRSAGESSALGAHFWVAQTPAILLNDLGSFLPVWFPVCCHQDPACVRAKGCLKNPSVCPQQASPLRVMH